MIEVNVRSARVEDIPVLMSFQQNLAWESEQVKLDPALLEKGIIAMFNDPGRGFYSLAEVNNEIVGCFMLTREWSDWRNGWAYWLQSVYVKESFRKHGVFRSMFQYLQQMLNNDVEAVGLRLYVDKSNLRAQQVYAAMGMNGDHYTVFELMKS